MKKKLKKKRKASQNEEVARGENEEMEGGNEENDNDLNDLDFNTQFQDNPNDQDTGVSVKKRKKRVLKKKLKKKTKKLTPKDADIDVSQPVYFDAKDQLVMYSNVKNLESKSRYPETIETVDQATEISQAQPAFVNEVIPQSKPEEIKESKAEIVVDKASERHYDGKRYCLTLLYGHRCIGTYFYYNDRLPRFLRLLILYISVFFVTLISGVFYFEYGNTNDVNGYIFIHSFGFSIVCTILDWILYLILILMFILKPIDEILNIPQKNKQFEETRIYDNINLDQSQENFSVYQSEENPNLQENKKKKSINKMSIILSCIVSGLIILACWGFKIISFK